MLITDEILDAVDRAAEHYGNISQLAKRIGIAHSTILFWKSKKTTHISGKIWAAKIRPVLEPFLQGECMVRFTARDSSSMPAYNVRQRSIETDHVSRDCVILNLAKMTEFDPALETVSSFSHSHSQNIYVFASKVERGCFAIRIDRAGIYNFPQGTAVLLSRETPANGSIVMVRVNKTGEILFRRYFRSEDMVSLNPLDEFDVAEPMCWNCQEARGVLLWAYPVMEVSLLPSCPSAEKSADDKQKQ